MNLNSDRRTVLCVDDSSDMLLTCRAILESVGFDVFTVSDAEAGLECLHQHSIDLAVIDNEMPGMGGVQLAAEMKHTCKDMPVLMFSGSLPEENDSVIDLRLAKSNGPDALLHAVQDLMRADHRPF